MTGGHFWGREIDSRACIVLTDISQIMEQRYGFGKLYLTSWNDASAL